MKVAGAIIAGGRSARFAGEEKALKPIGAKTILARIIEIMTPQADRLIINANGDVSRFAFTGLHVVPDELTEYNTPLAGIHASLAWAMKMGFDAVVTVPSDTPFLPTDLVARFVHQAHTNNSAIAASSGRSHFTTGLWRTTLCQDLRDFLVDLGGRRASDWTSRIKPAVVEWTVTPCDPFFNVNTAENLDEARRIANEFGL